MTTSNRFRAYTAVVLFLTIVSTATAQYSGGTGEPNDPYRIATAADLIALGETPADYDKHFILTTDIDLDPNLPGRKVFDKAVIAPDTDPGDQNAWGPVFAGNSFSGIFDGNGHTISHLTVRGEGYLGLFGQLGTWSPVGEVRGLGLADVNIAGSGYFVGGLVGQNSGTMTECHSTGAVSGGSHVGGLVGYHHAGTVTQCHSTAVVKGKGVVGGLVGDNYYGTVIDCYSTGAVSATSVVGGLVGDNYCGTVIDCYSTGAVSAGDFVGGLVGSSWGDDVDTDARVTGCYSTGTVSGTDCVGGLVGENGSCGFVTRCYSTGAVSATGDVGGLFGWVFTWAEEVNDCFWDIQTSGQTTSAGGTGKTTAQMQDPNTFVAAGWDFVGHADGPHDVWAERSGGGYPILCWQLPDKSGLPGFAGGTGEPNDPYRISTAKELNSIGCNPRLMQCHFKLVADLDLTGVHFYPIGDYFRPYGGTFDGNGHTVSHLTIKGVGDVGMFGCLAGEIEKLGIVDANVTGSGSYIGGLVGYNYRGTVTQCYSTGAVNATEQYSSVGGLVGYNYGGTVTQCYSTSVVSGGWTRVGGLVGRNYGVVIQCYSVCFPRTTGFFYGLVGYDGSFYGIVTACFWDSEASGQPATPGAGGIPTTTAGMQTAKTFIDAGWDFVGETANGTEDIWWINEGKDYPHLWWEIGDGASP